MIRRLACQLAILAVALAGASAWAQESPRVGVTERLGETVPLAELTFRDETGQAIQLGSLFDRPVVLTLVYFGCPGICTPLLHEVAQAADQAEPTPGKDYRLVTISFNPKDTPAMAAVRRETQLAAMSHKKPPADAWRVLVGDAENIRRITAAVGFGYQPSPNGVDFVHPAMVAVLSGQGKIVRYFYLGSAAGPRGGLVLNPADLELAVVDAATGRPRSFIQSIQQVCYARDPKSGRMVLAVDRIILAFTGVVAAAFVVYLVRQGRRRKRRMNAQTGVATDGHGSTLT